MADAPALNETGLRQAIDRVLAANPVVGLAIGVVRDGGLAFFHSHGVADLSGRPIRPDTVFRIASITKTVTAVAIMQLHEQGVIDLDAPAQAYLRSYRLTSDDPTWPDPTVRQLLTHTAGLGELARPSGLLAPDFGESVPVGTRLPNLAEFYGGSIRIRARPGSRFVYGNHSPATLGQVVEDVTGMPLGSYVRGHIAEPLGMASTDMNGSAAATSRLATGYEIRARRVQRVRERDMLTLGAAGLLSTPLDMARYLAALLGGGRNEHGCVLAADSVAQMMAPQYSPHPRIPGMGLSFFRAEVGGHPVVGHQGTHPGFHSQIYLAPDQGLGVMAFTNGAHRADFWLPAATLGLLRQLLGVPAAADLPPLPDRPAAWDDRVGWYRLDAGATDVRLRGMIGFGVEVAIRGGHLILRFLSPVPALARGFPLVPAHPDDHDVYGIDLGEPGIDPFRVVFDRDRSGPQRLHLEGMHMPLTLVRQPASTNPRRWGLAALGAMGGLAAAGAATRRLSPVEAVG